MNDPVADILLKAEISLAETATKLAAARDYDRATVVLGLAREISTLASKWSRPTSTPKGELTEVGSSPERQEARSIPQSTASVRRRSKKDAYPQFYRHGDHLVKVGYSKGEGEYEHKAPKQVLFLLVDAILKGGANGAQFTMNEVLPVAAQDGTEPPSYQLYLCLNWLRTIGLVKQHGRQGYSITKASDWSKQLQARWEQLPPPGRS
jgi:hypothetical protein